MSTATATRRPTFEVIGVFVFHEEPDQVPETWTMPDRIDTIPQPTDGAHIALISQVGDDEIEAWEEILRKAKQRPERNVRSKA